LTTVLAGGSGVISVIGQAYPKEFSSLINFGLQGKNKEAYAMQFKLIDIINLIFTENNPTGIKTVLQELNITSDEVRLPLVKSTPENQKEIANFVKNF
jgi:4-hydroxy-tetrahydrodipicolinate synthase